jgi:hypothetical protein
MTFSHDFDTECLEDARWIAEYQGRMSRNGS